MEHGDVQSGLVINPKYPFLSASPDGCITCSCYEKSLIEVKCLYQCCDKIVSRRSCEWQGLLCDYGWWNILLDKINAYFYQVQYQLNACKIDLCYFNVWSPNEAVCVEITSDQSVFEEFFPTIDSFVIKAILLKVIVQYFTRKPQKGKKWPLVRILLYQCCNYIQWYFKWNLLYF